MSPACDAINELVFDDEASVARCLADAAFPRTRGSALLDPASVACLVVEEHVAKASAAPLDGLAITWFDDVAAMRAGTRTEAYAKTRADERNFLAGELPFVVTTERVTFPRVGLVARHGSLLGLF